MMRKIVTSDLYDKKVSEKFYEERYESGYMEDWPDEKKQKIYDVIQELNLPESGEALDFGCGNGVLTDVLKQALPSWTIYGTDLSTNAINYANKHYTNCIFFEAEHPDFINKKFDFVFTHHVFEHVFDLKEVFSFVSDYLKSESSMLHILPCGNAGSFEHEVCKLIINGINAEVGNRFFYEDEGHVRRLTTDEFNEVCKSKNYELENALYSNQLDGAIEWISRSGVKTVNLIADISNAIDDDARRKLLKLKVRLMVIALLRAPVQLVPMVKKRRNKKAKHYIYLGFGCLLWVFSLPVDKFWKRKAKIEWDKKKYNSNGSEMFLFYKKK